MRKPIIVFSIFAALFFILASYSARQKCATSDEPTHISAGYVSLSTGDFRLNPEHPPLVKMLSAVPLLFLRPKADYSDASSKEVGDGNMGWRSFAQGDFASKFLYQWNDAERVTFWARIPIILLSIILGCFVGWWAWTMYGWKSGCLALLLYLTTPDLLAHSQLVTTDLGVACFLFIAVFGFHRSLRSLTLGNLLLTCVGTGCVLATKFSGPLIFPIFGLIALVFAYSGETSEVPLMRVNSPLRHANTFTAKLVLAGALITLSALIGLVVIWACYGFRYRISPDANVSTGIDWIRYWAKEGLANDFMQAIQSWRLVPEGYALGFFDASESIERRLAFLLGAHSETGWWYYFIVSFLVKTPLPLIGLIIAGCVFIKRFGASLVDELMLLTPVVVYMLVAVSSNINIGNRHILPIYPFLIVLASKMARVFDSFQPRLLAVVCGLLIVWNVIELGRIYPYDLAYFNQIAGGPAGGYKWLVDSNLDWGQDLKGLAKYRREHPEEPFYLAYFGSASPEYYGIKAKYLPSLNVEAFRNPGSFARFSDVKSGSVVAVSATSLQCAVLDDRMAKGVEQFMQRLKNLTPVATIGYSIFIYRIP
jgi:hypothetical protein